MWGRPLILICVVITAQSGPSADFAPCKSDDEECTVKNSNIIFENIITGIPSANIESLDPMVLEEINANLATIDYKIPKSTVKGLKGCKTTDMDMSEEKLKMHMVFDCPHFKMFGRYEVDGRILTFPIQGKGDFDMDCIDYHIVVDADLKVTENNGKKYFSLKNYKHTGELHGGMVNMTNLFNGQKELGDTLLKVLNENYPIVANELQGPVLAASVKKIVKNLNKYLKTKPIDSLIV